MRLLTVLLVFLLSACGFQLRKDFVLPASLSPIRVELADSFSPLQRNLEQLLRSGGAGVAADSNSAGSVLSVPINSTRLAPLIVGQTGRVQEYVLFHTVEFELFDANGAQLVERQRVELQREFLFDSIGAVGSPGEQELIARELELEMAQSILRRLQVALDN